MIIIEIMILMKLIIKKQKTPENDFNESNINTNNILTLKTPDKTFYETRKKERINEVIKKNTFEYNNESEEEYEESNFEKPKKDIKNQNDDSDGNNEINNIYKYDLEDNKINDFNQSHKQNQLNIKKEQNDFCSTTPLNDKSESNDNKSNIHNINEDIEKNKIINDNNNNENDFKENNYQREFELKKEKDSSNRIYGLIYFKMYNFENKKNK